MASLLKRFRRYLRRRREIPRHSVFDRVASWVRRIRKQQTVVRGKNRRRRQLAWGSAWLLGCAFFVGGLAYLSHVDAIEIQHVTITGNAVVDTKDIETVIQDEISGRYGYLFSERNIVIYPKERVTASLLNAFPRLANVSLARESLTDISVSVTEREPHALWCGLVYVVEDTDSKESCFFLDATGFIFAPAPHFTGDVFFTYYGTSSAPTKDILGSTYLPEQVFTRLSALIDGFRELEFEPVAFSQPNDVDFKLHFKNGSYVLFRRNQEYVRVLENFQSVIRADAFKTESAEKELSYIDLRFDNKIFYLFE